MVNHKRRLSKDCEATQIGPFPAALAELTAGPTQPRDPPAGLVAPEQSADRGARHLAIAAQRFLSSFCRETLISRDKE